MKFRGHAHRSLDPKGRLILPQHWRDAILGQAAEARIVLTLYENHVIGITPAQWEALESELEKIKAPSKNMRNLQRMLYGGYEEVAVGRQGRIQIPAHLRKSGKLNKEVVLLGVGKRFEILPEGRFEDVLGQEFDDVSEELAQNGASLPF
ncbi:MAG: division/cell wall cluster transcriptional repressor MraZ [Desulfovibrionaceae bacterium]|nr:division/cell wall cluster transcriptional repressor MraZ [Desulfovibrionaceae bacterium]MDD4951606.1 division/cell wall cluster transcriptional repressor MraZ [Desulfovibrionaceae bacterium]